MICWDQERDGDTATVTPPSGPTPAATATLNLRSYQLPTTFSDVISGRSYAKNSPYVLLRTRLTTCTHRRRAKTINTGPPCLIAWAATVVIAEEEDPHRNIV